MPCNLYLDFSTYIFWTNVDQVTEIMENKATSKGTLLHLKFLLSQANFGWALLSALSHQPTDVLYNLKDSKYIFWIFNIRKLNYPTRYVIPQNSQYCLYLILEWLF